MFAVSVRQSVCHAAQPGFAVRGSLGATFAKSLRPLVVQPTRPRDMQTDRRPRYGINNHNSPHFVYSIQPKRKKIKKTDNIGF